MDRAHDYGAYCDKTAHCAGSSQLINTELCHLNEVYEMDYRYVQFIAAGPETTRVAPSGYTV